MKTSQQQKSCTAKLTSLKSGNTIALATHQAESLCEVHSGLGRKQSSLLRAISVPQAGLDANEATGMGATIPSQRTKVQQGASILEVSGSSGGKLFRLKAARLRHLDARFVLI